MSDDEWKDVNDAPHACHVLACYFDEEFGEWVYEVVLSPPPAHFEWWQHLPERPTKRKGRL